MKRLYPETILSNWSIALNARFPLWLQPKVIFGIQESVRHVLQYVAKRDAEVDCYSTWEIVLAAKY